MKNKDAKLFLKTLNEISGRLDEITLLLEEYIQLKKPQEIINIQSTDTNPRLKAHFPPGYPSYYRDEKYNTPC